jgi:phytoene dehydrogenase-like protein
MTGMSSSFDAIIVGAGANGLAAGIHLAAEGWKVAAVEEATAAGAAIKTRELTAIRSAILCCLQRSSPSKARC